MRRNEERGLRMLRLKSRKSLLRKNLQDSLDVVLLHQNYLDKKLSDLTNKVASSSSVSFERANEKFLFLYPSLDLRPLNHFKVIKEGVMVDKDAMTFP